MPPQTLPDWLAYLERLHPKTIQLGLERVCQVRTRMLLQPRFPIITVGGTNGKGSTCAILERILSVAGYRVGCYTSPHLLRYNERVRVQCREAEDEALCQAFAAVESVRGETPLTYFEFGTLAALRHFVDIGVEVAVLEVGLGGRLDAVNAFEPDCAVITSIDLDHQDYLGDSRESIGFEKAGIYRQGRPAICGDLHPPSTVPERARAIGADYRQIGRDFGFVAHDGGWDFWSGRQRYLHLPLPPLSGSFQLGNAACALEALTALQARLPVSESRLRESLAQVELAGRFQVLPGRPAWVLDVAHNPHAAHGLAENLRQTRGSGRTLAVFAMLADKDVRGVVQAVAEEIDAWFVAGIDQPRGATAEQMAQMVRSQLPTASVAVYRSVPEALGHACRSAEENDRIVVFGSFYTVAYAMRAHPTLGNSKHGG
ncbi:MAG: bifunctional tetrahydrofolate synthase/dihydrofolate synthase [Methylophilaceae bacterium]|nr:bifunctional tetrahydrofolate synthase/dihydrofolate synthase [Methylophilaceae bacterium]